MYRALVACLAVAAGLALSIQSSPGAPAAVPPVPIVSPMPTIASPTPQAMATTPFGAASAPATPSATPEPRSIEGVHIVIERLAIDLPLVWGDVQRDVPREGYPGATPERVALVFPGSALPGTGGNTYVYSHARTGMFLSLWQARFGDQVVLRWPDGWQLGYVVTEIVPRVDPSDTRWLDAAGPERLTLQTSTGPYPWNPRFIVVAVPLGRSS